MIGKALLINIINYSVDDFSETECLAVTDLTQALKDMMLNGDDKAEKSGVFVRENFRSILRLTLKNKGEQNVSSAVRNLKKRSDIISVQPDRVMELQSAPNDTYYASGEQWALNGKNGIHADEAWTITTGSPDVKVGVVDSGVDASHPDLTNRVNRDLSLESFDENTGGAFVDNVGHGTHVAGIIGAHGNNGIGIVGVNHDVTIISYKISTNVNIYCSDMISMIGYAIANNVRVLNNSICFEEKYFNLFFASKMEAVEWILYNYSGLFVSAAGNARIDFNENTNLFPACANADNLIVVGALNKNGNIWDHSNYGNKVDIYAPGADIISTIPVNNEQAGYKSMSGTSMAAPHVTGVAALMLSVNSRLTGRDMKKIILNNCDTITITLPNGKSQTVKKLNAYKAVKAAQTYIAI